MARSGKAVRFRSRRFLRQLSFLEKLSSMACAWNEVAQDFSDDVNQLEIEYAPAFEGDESWKVNRGVSPAIRSSPR